MNDQGEWHLSKTIPVTFVLAIAMQTIALVWFISALNNDVEHNAREIVRHENRIESLETIVHSQALVSARMDENIKAIRIAVEKMGEN